MRRAVEFLLPLSLLFSPATGLLDTVVPTPPIPISGRVLTPPYFNLAEGRRITATATCGHGVSEPELYCKLVGAHADYKDNPNVNLIQGQVCDFCDPSNSALDHAPENAIDGTERWWQSPPLSRGSTFNHVNLTIDLGQEFHVAYVFIKMANSPRPGIWALERSTDLGKTWEPWQYFADTYSDCVNYFGHGSLGPITRDDSVVCETKFSKVVPLEGGEVVVSLLNDRPSANNFYNSTVLQEWTKATNIRLRLIRTKTLLGHLMSVARQDPTVTRRYYYSIRDISIGGRCVCNGHAETCDITDPEDRYKLLCRCQHNTCGSQCDTCCPGFVQKKWRPATIYNTNACERCNCHGHSDECVYDEEVDRLFMSKDLSGQNIGGGVCQNCQHFTEGINCDRCKPGYYKPYGRLLNATDVCIECPCHNFNLTGSCADGTGKCFCREEFLPPHCNDCNVGYFGYPNCRPCDCHLNGTRGRRCEVGGGQCPCKPNYTGKNCDECAEGYFNFPECRPCECNADGSVNDICDKENGQCACHNSYGGRTCSDCEDGFYSYPLCTFCNCDRAGCLPEVCNKTTGSCLCKEGYGGSRCDHCFQGYYGYPNCKPCGCNDIGSVGNTCDEGGRCQCLHNFAGLTCNQCSPGYYSYPDCLACNCDSTGAVGISCDGDGKCRCKPNFDGITCNSCKSGFYNYPACEECNCNPAGVLPTFAGCGTLTTGELCQCKERVGGRTCNQCRPLYWNLQAYNPEGCEECDCHLSGTIGSINVCDGGNGQCLCKPNIVSRRCEECRDGTYGLTDQNLFGCIDCGCDIGGAFNQVCDKQLGQCTCRPRVSGRTCNEPHQFHYFPTLYHYQYEIENGYTPANTPVRFSYDNNIFPSYSWKGYAVFSPLQLEVQIKIFIDKPSLYRAVLHYVNKGEKAARGQIIFNPDSGGEIQQSSVLKLAVHDQPQLYTVSASDTGSPPSHFVLNPGWWTVSIKMESPVFLDYLVLLPAAYYEATLLHEVVRSPCYINSNESSCLHYAYPDVDDFTTVRGEGGYIAEEDERRPTQLYSSEELLEYSGKGGEMAHLNNDQRDVRLSLSLPKIGRYVLVVIYYTPEDGQMTTLEVDASSATKRQKGRSVLYRCRYTHLCRQAVIDVQGKVIIFNFEKHSVQLHLKVPENANVAVEEVVAIPAKQWHTDYVTPQIACTQVDGSCIVSKFNIVPDTIKVEAEFGNEDQKTEKFPINVLDDDIGLIYLNHKEALVDIHGQVPNSGQYVFVIHYYQPHFPAFDMDVLVQNGQFYEGILPVPFCPSNSGCRSIVRTKEGEFRFFILEKFILTLKEPNHKDVWVDYLLIIPAASYKEDVLKEMPLDRAVEFITLCGQNNFYANNHSNQLCKDSIFSLTTEYNMGALPCQCNFDGSNNSRCEPFGGQCPCKPNVIGRSCTECRTGHFGFPECKPCSCPSTAVCHPETGDCICPPRVMGEKCDTCLQNTYGFDPIIGCSECNCKPQGVEGGNLQCNLFTGYCECKRNVVGRTCDQCKSGYWSFPYCQLCDCDLRGTTIDICDGDTSHCFCKDNVYGLTCDQCKPGTFHMEEKNPLGCTKCFCFGRTDRCISSTLSRYQVSDAEDWTVVYVHNDTAKLVEDAPTLTVIVDGNQLLLEPPSDIPKDQALYFSAPSEYLGNKITSYGGSLEYMLSFTLNDEAEDDDNKLLIIPEVILKGRNMTIMYDHFEQPASGEPLHVIVPISEHSFYQLSGADHHTVTREQLMMILNKLEAIYIRGSYFTGMKELSIKRVLLDIAIPEYLADAPQAMTVEQCHCPPGYRGLSCEDCTSGFYRTSTGPYGGYCIPCECHGHSDSCDPITGKCLECQHNTTGEHCEKCVAGFHGDATYGTPYDCLICACPLPTMSNNFAVSCEFSASGLEIRCECKPGYYGPRCNHCAAGFYGRPEIPFETCKPCECSGNIDSSNFGSCDSQTGECLQCLNNTFGAACELCAPGYFGDAIDIKDCKSCNCDQCGTRNCHPSSGICQCQLNVVGDRCDECAPGYWNFGQCTGCVSCDCGSASENSQCDLHTGQCVCKPGVMGRTCNQCKPGFWDYGSSGCRPCGCNIEHSIGGSCNVRTGQCECLPGVVGDQCDHCPYRWVLIENIGCRECDTCVHMLLDDVGNLHRTLAPVVTEMESVSLAYFAYQRLNHINDTVNRLRGVVDLLIYDPSAVDLRPLDRQITNLERDSKFNDREANATATSAQKISLQAEELKLDALELEKMLRATTDDVRATVDDIRDLTYRIVAGKGPDVDRKITEAEQLLADIKNRNFEHPHQRAELEEDDAQDTLDRAKQFAGLIQKSEEEGKVSKDRLSDLGKRLEELMNASVGIRKKVIAAKELLDPRKFEGLRSKIAGIEDVMKNIKKQLDMGDKLLDDAREFLAEAKKGFGEILNQNAERLREATEKLRKKVDGMTNELHNLGPIVEEAKEHAQRLEDQANELDGLLADTRQTSENAVKAANSYTNIVEAINEALRAAEAAVETANQAKSMSEGKDQEADASKDKSLDLLEQAQQAAARVKPALVKRMVDAKDGVDQVAVANQKTQDDLDKLNKGMDRLPVSVLRPMAAQAGNMSNAAMDKAQRTLDVIYGIEEKLKGDRERAEQIPRDIDEANKAIKRAHAQVEKARSTVPQIIQMMGKINNHSKVLRILGVDVGDKIAHLRFQIARSRDRANGISLGVNFTGDSWLQIQNPDGLSQSASYTKLSLYFKTKERNGLLVYLGNEIGTHRNMRRALTDDYIALVLDNGQTKLIMNMGSGIQQVVNRFNVVDDKWHQVIAERTGNSATLTIKTEGEADEVVESPLSGTHSVLNLDQELSKFYVGGIPSDAQIQRDIRHRLFNGWIEELTFEDHPVGLWNFVRAQNIDGCVERDQLVTLEPSTGLRFDGSGYAILNYRSTGSFQKRIELMFQFRTYASNGLFFLMGKDSDFFSVELQDGHVLYQFNLGSGTATLKSRMRFNDGQWHTVQASRQGREAVLRVNGKEVAQGQSPGTLEDLAYTSNIYIGGYPGNHTFKPVTNIDLEGCIDNLQIGTNLFDLNKNREALGVVSGCPTKVARTISFGDDSTGYVAMPSPSLDAMAQFTFKFKTDQNDNLLLYTANEDYSNYISIALSDGQLVFMTKPGGELRSGNASKYNDREWHYVTATRHNDHLRLDIDDYESFETKLPGKASISITRPLYVGGLGPGVRVPRPSVASTRSLVGCIGDMTVNGLFQNYANTTDRRGGSFASCPLTHPSPTLFPSSSEYTLDDAQTSAHTEYIPERTRRPSALPFTQPAPTPTAPIKISSDTCALSKDLSRIELAELGAIHYGVHANSRNEFTINPSQFRSSTNISLEFKTTFHNGVMLYISNSKGTEFVGLYFRDGTLTFAYDFGNAQANLPISGTYIDGNWHAIDIVRYMDDVQIFLDNNPVPLSSGRARGDVSLTVESPLYVGGISETVAQTASNNLEGVVNSFNGCIHKVTVNGKVVDPEKTYFTKSCLDAMETGHFFGPGGGHIAMFSNAFRFGRDKRFEFEMKPRVMSGLLMAVFGKKDFFVLQLINGTLKVTVDNGPGAFSASVTPPEMNSLCDGSWHHIQVVKSRNIVFLHVDDRESVQHGPVSQLAVDATTPLYFGGVPARSPSRGIEVNEPFVGCIRNVQIDGKITQLSTGKRMGDVTFNVCPTN